MEMMTPAQVWAGYDPQTEDLKAKLLSEEESKRTYAYFAISKGEEAVVIELNVFTPAAPTKKTVLLIGEYDRLPQQDLIDDLLSKNYLVCYADYSAIKQNTTTSFPPCFCYGKYANAGEHIKKLSPSAKDTCQYLYSVIIRRAITFINQELSQKEIVLVGIKSGVEIAMQVAGMDNRILALACIGGAGYMEYLDKPKYAGEENLLSDELMAWLTSVSSVAYAKHIKIPTLFSVGSNGKLNDIDRLSNIIALMPKSDARINISPRHIDNISKKSYLNFIKWLEGVFLYSTPPEIPVMDINVNSEGAVYASIKPDSSIEISGVKVYYSYGDNNHTTRYWFSALGEKAGEADYLAKMAVSQENSHLYAFCEVTYRNGIVLSSIVYHIDLSNFKIKTEIISNNPIVFQYSTHEGNFTEVREDAVIINDSISENELPIGIKGLKCSHGSMVTFFKPCSELSDTKLLQIDTYSESKTYNLSITIICCKGERKEYYCEKTISVSDSYFSLRLNVNDFKDKDYLPLDTWQCVRGLIINSIGVTVGKIMFI